MQCVEVVDDDEASFYLRKTRESGERANNSQTRERERERDMGKQR